MSKQEILTKAIEKAEKGGFDLWEWWEDLDIGFCPAFTENEKIVEYLNLCEGFIPLLLTDHAFARALWGDGEPFIDDDGTQRGYCYGEDIGGGVDPLWKMYLREMVVSEDWLAYVGGTL